MLLKGVLEMLKLQNFIKHLVPSKRKIWGYVAIAFNSVDLHRLEHVGPDRMCAEWVLKNGGKIGFVGGGGRLLSDYNSLPPEASKLNVQIVDASNSSIMKIGLEHFRNCKHIDTVILDGCKYMEEDSLDRLVYLRSSLKKLQISRCDNLEEKSFDVIGELNNLQHLRLYRFLYIKDLDGLVTKLKKTLPNCKIDTESKSLI